jgi:hypothetical protein
MTWWAWLLIAIWYVGTALGSYRLIDADPVDRVAVGIWCAVWPVFLLVAAGVWVVEAIGLRE